MSRLGRIGACSSSEPLPANTSAPPGPNRLSSPAVTAHTVIAHSGHAFHLKRFMSPLPPTAGAAISLTLTGHTHTVTLSQTELTQISTGTRVQKTSSNDNAHTHTVTFN